MPMPEAFPKTKLGADANPGIQLFGKRFFIDQTILEHLAELLLILNSPKRLDKTSTFDNSLPSWEQIQCWPTGKNLEYKVPIRLNLKLFALLGASRIDSRHESHKQHYKDVLVKLENVIRAEGVDKRDVLRSLENLFLGFQGVGLDRTWCAQTLYPLSKAFLCSEAIWEQTKARRDDVTTWDQAIQYFSYDKRIFMARGGEVLYLQLCNAFRKRDSQLDNFLVSYDLTENEKNPQSLLTSLDRGLRAVTTKVPEVLDAIAYLVDKIDGSTWDATNRHESFTECGWCPEESWREGYLFAVELSRLCSAVIDPIERIELLMVGCGLQILRSLCAQTMRYCNPSTQKNENGLPLNFAWIISDPEGREHTMKQLSQRNMNILLAFIQNALRTKEIYENAQIISKIKIDKLYDEADTRYGHKLFLSIGKRLGFIVPKRGPGARFVFNERILRYLVLTMIPPGSRRTYEDFKRALYTHYGIAIEGEQLADALSWCDFPRIDTGGTMGSSWLMAMLQASGFLVHLSDACSLVQNPFSLDQSLSSRKGG
jgi:hypothetical protein